MQRRCWTSKGEGPATWSWDGEHRGTSVMPACERTPKSFLKKLNCEIIKRYSNFLPWPIDLGEQINSGKAPWVESPAQVTERRRRSSTAIAMDWMPALRIHMKLDGRSRLFRPLQRPHDLFYPDMKKGP